MGRRRNLERERVEHRAPVFHAERQRVADQGGDVPLRAALPEIQARGRLEGRGARQGQRLRPEGRISDPLRAHGAERPRRAAAGLRTAQEEARGRRPLRPGAQAAAAGASPPHRHCHLARWRGAARHRSRTAPALSERAPGDVALARAGRRRRARDRARDPQDRAHRRRRRRHRRRAAADRWRISGRSTKKCWRA